MNKPAVILAISTVIMVSGVLLFAKSAGTANRQQAASDAKADLVSSTSYRYGPDTATVTIVEFGDYQCPACASVEPILKHIVEEHNGQVSLVFRHFPLPMHAQSMSAAQAAEAAGLQGKYWEMHNLLYARQSEWSENGSSQSHFISYADELGLDGSKFTSDLTNADLQHKIASDKLDATALKLEGTPSIFINGQLYQGKLDYTSINAVITAELQ